MLGVGVVGDEVCPTGWVGFSHLGKVPHGVGFKGFPLPRSVGGGYNVAGVNVSSGTGVVGLLHLHGAANGVIDIFGPVSGTPTGGVGERVAMMYMGHRASATSRTIRRSRAVPL